MFTFIEKERECEKIFEQSGPFLHLYTDGGQMEDFLISEDDFKAAMIALAITAILCPSVLIITFELMGNHIHLILNGDKDICLEFFDKFKIRLRRILSGKEKFIDWTHFSAEILPIDSLTALRNEIIYVNRNGFVVHSKYTPFSYPWGGGCAYFTPVLDLLPAKSVKEIGFNRTRELTHFREVSQLEGLKFVGDQVFIPSFCRIDLGESLFRDARSYFHSLTRNAEAFSQIAERLKDTVFLTDDELYAAAVKYAESSFQTRQLGLLNPDQKIRLAKELHFKYNASNQQIRRLLKLNISILNELFPS